MTSSGGPRSCAPHAPHKPRGDAMPKEIKGNAGRKPPEPSLNHGEIDEWITRQMPHLQDILRRVDREIIATIPNLHFSVHRKRPYYGLAPFGWIIEIAAYDVSANVVFFGGADFTPPPPLGTTDRTRYIKLTTVAEAEGMELRKWIEQAGHTPGWQ
jgi:hypothetical protein